MISQGYCGVRAPGVTNVCFRRNFGPGIRWKAAQELGGLVAVLDDDVTLEPSYLERTAAPVRQGWAEASAWSGVDLSMGFIRFGKRLGRARRMSVLGGGTTVVDSSYLGGVTQHPAAARFLGRGGGDDGWVSAVLRANGARLVRPAGVAPLSDLPEQNDPRSIRWSRSHDAAKLFLALWVFGPGAPARWSASRACAFPAVTSGS